MNHMIAVFVFLTSAAVFANTEGKSNVSYSMAGLEVGFKWSAMDADGAASNKQSMGYVIGGSATFDVAQNFAIKSGLFYNERPFNASTPPLPDVKGKITYFDIPVLLMFKFEDYAGVYFGPSLSIKMSDEVSIGSLSKVKGTVIPITIGGQFKFASNLGINIYFESVSGELAKDLENSRAVGANLLITFD